MLMLGSTPSATVLCMMQLCDERFDGDPAGDGHHESAEPQGSLSMPSMPCCLESRLGEAYREIVVPCQVCIEAAATLAALNGAGFQQRLLEDLRALSVQRSVCALEIRDRIDSAAKEQMDVWRRRGARCLRQCVASVLAACADSEIFTPAYDRRSYNLGGPAKRQLASVRLRKVRKLYGKQTIQVARVQRLALALHFAKLSPFLGRNGFALLERHLIETLQRQHAWLQQPGCMMGPGALRGRSLLKGHLRTFRTAAGGLADAVMNFEEMEALGKLLNRLVKQEMQRVQNLKRQGSPC